MFEFSQRSPREDLDYDVSTCKFCPMKTRKDSIRIRIVLERRVSMCTVRFRRSETIILYCLINVRIHDLMCINIKVHGRKKLPTLRRVDYKNIFRALYDQNLIIL